MGSLADLDRRMSKKIETGRGIQLSPEDLDLLVATGAYDAFRNAVAEHQRNQCLQRSARNRSTSAGIIGSTRGRTGQTSKSSGTTTSADASEALARAQAITMKRA